MAKRSLRQASDKQSSGTKEDAATTTRGPKTTTNHTSYNIVDLGTAAAAPPVPAVARLLTGAMTTTGQPVYRDTPVPSLATTPGSPVFRAPSVASFATTPIGPPLTIPMVEAWNRLTGTRRPAQRVSTYPAAVASPETSRERRKVEGEGGSGSASERAFSGVGGHGDAATAAAAVAAAVHGNKSQSNGKSSERPFPGIGSGPVDSAPTSTCEIL